MKTFKTPKGTELIIEDIKGKDYLPAAQRIRWFREDHPFGRIDTERISESKDHVTYRATIYVPCSELLLEKQVKISNADKTIKIINNLDYEKCETMAIGRALAMAGYGTQFAVDDLEEVEVPATKEPKPEQEKQKTPEKKEPQKESIPKRNLRVMSIGKHTGKTFEDLLKEDSSHGFQYSKWLKKESERAGGYGKMHADQKAFYNYAKEEGVYGE